MSHVPCRHGLPCMLCFVRLLVFLHTLVLIRSPNRRITDELSQCHDSMKIYLALEQLVFLLLRLYLFALDGRRAYMQGSGINEILDEQLLGTCCLFV